MRGASSTRGTKWVLNPDVSRLATFYRRFAAFRPRFAPTFHFYFTTATASISMRASRGKRATCTVERAGGSPLNFAR